MIKRLITTAIFWCTVQGVVPETPKKVYQPQSLEYYAAAFIAEKLINKSFKSNDPMSLRKDIDALAVTEVTREIVIACARAYLEDALRRLGRTVVLNP